MLLSVKRGVSSLILRVKLQNSSVSTGAGLTGLTSASAGLKIATIADPESTTTLYAQASSNIETITTLGTYAAPTASKCRFKEVDATNHPGVYEIQIADARFAVSSSKTLLVSINGATNLAECDVTIQLNAIDFHDAVRAGLSALPNAAAEAAGGLYTNGSGAGQITQDANGRINVNVAALSGDGTAADNAESYFDGNGYNGSANTVGTCNNLVAMANGIITAAKFGTGALDAGALNADAVAEIVSGIRAMAVDGAVTLQQILSLHLAWMAGLSDTGGTRYYAPDGTTVRLSGTVNGSNERTAVTKNPAA